MAEIVSQIQRQCQDMILIVLMLNMDQSINPSFNQSSPSYILSYDFKSGSVIKSYIENDNTLVD